MKTTLFIALQQLLPQHALSRLTGALARCRWPWLKDLLIGSFIRYFKVDMSEAAEPNPKAYPHFNAFFTRPLKEGARPFPADDRLILCPADGSISEMGKLHAGRILQAKGRSYSATALLGGRADWGALFEDGHFATVYLSPRDYHRVHMPVAGTLTDMLYVPGDLFSVNQTTAEEVDNLFARNERLVCLFETEYGPMAVVLVGALIVAGIETPWAGQVAPAPLTPRQLYSLTPSQPIQLERGAEMGRFWLGSTAIVLFGKDRINWLEGWQAGRATRMGEAMGQPLSTQE